MELEKQKLYDQVISTLITNILAEKKHNDGKIILKQFNPKDSSHMLYYQTATIVSDISNSPIYLNMKLWDYIKFVYHNFKRWKTLKWITNAQISEWELDQGNEAKIASVTTIVSFVKEFFLKEKSLDFGEFDSIYDQVYGGINDTDNCD